MSLKSVKFAIAFIAASKIAFIGSVHQVDVCMTSQVCLTNKSFVTLMALKWFIISLEKYQICPWNFKYYMNFLMIKKSLCILKCFTTWQVEAFIFSSNHIIDCDISKVRMHDVL